jgi:DNA-binding HxlR family transcriptional regulator
MLATMLGGGEDDELDPYGDSIQSPRWPGQLEGPDEPFSAAPSRELAGDAQGSRGQRPWTPLARALAATGDQWTLPIVLALANGPRRLSDLRAQLPGISTGVLNRHLQQMLALELILRQRFRELPPRVEYKLTGAGAALLPIVTDLARWGMHHMWSLPHTRERIDVGSLLRLLPTLLLDEDPPDGVIEMIIELPEGVDRHLFNITQGHMMSVELGSMMPWARLAGPPSDWIDALGPRCEAGALQITGDRQLALQLLQALPRGA